MNDGLLFSLTLIAALGCGVVSGAFFAFSAFVMKALARLEPPQGIAAMQSINIVAITPPLMVALFGTALLCLLSALASLLDRQAPGALYRIAGSLLYLVGTVIVTIAFNVPRNNALAAVDPLSAAGAAAWGRYVPSWTARNTARTIAALLAAALLTMALVVDR